MGKVWMKYLHCKYNAQCYYIKYKSCNEMKVTVYKHAINTLFPMKNFIKWYKIYQKYVLIKSITTIVSIFTSNTYQMCITCKKDIYLIIITMIVIAVIKLYY